MFLKKKLKMRKHPVAILKRTHAQLPTYAVHSEHLFNKYGDLLCQWVHLNRKMKLHTFSTDPEVDLTI